MKKLLTVACLSASLCMVFFSCKEESTNELNVDYSDYTVEQNKENIQNEGLEVIQKMEAMQGMEFASSAQDLMELMEAGMTEDEYYQISKLLSPLAKADNNIMAVASLRASNTSMDSLSNLFKRFSGVYTYNKADSSFDHQPSTTEITVKFPIGNSTTNNGTLTINNFTYQYAKNADFVGTEMPKSLNITMKKGSTTLISFTMSASYNDKDLPKSEKTVLTFKEGYSFTQTGTYESKAASWDFNFAYNNEAFFTGGFDLGGTFQYDSLKVVDSDDDLVNLLNTVNATIQIGNLKAIGQIAYAQMKKDMITFREKENTIVDSTSYAAYVDEMCELFNKNLKATILYADSKKAIAKLVFYKDLQMGEMTKWPVMNFKMMFSDESAMDGSFFKTGFDQLQTAWYEFEADMKSSYDFDKDDYTNQPF